MTTTADDTIEALRATHSELAPAVAALTPDQLTGGSGAAEWSVAQVLSHLGSGAEITLAALRAALAGSPGPGQDANQTVWDRWNAMSAQEQADGFLDRDEQLIAAMEALTAEQRQRLKVDMGFLPEPVSVSTFAAMRLNEAAQHSWDVRVAREDTATLSEDTAAVLTEHFATDLAFLLGFTGKADALAQPVVVALQDSGYAIVVADSVSLSTSASEPTATFTGSLEAAVRLLAGRLDADYTPAGVSVSGAVTLDDLRRVFPGY